MTKGTWIIWKPLDLAIQVYLPVQAEGPSAFKGCFYGGKHTYIKDKGRGWSQALDTNVWEHFQHVAFPACHVHESAKVVIEMSVGKQAGWAALLRRRDGPEMGPWRQGGVCLQRWVGFEESEVAKCIWEECVPVPRRHLAGGKDGMVGEALSRRELMWILKLTQETNVKTRWGPIAPRAWNTWQEQPWRVSPLDTGLWRFSVVKKNQKRVNQ